MGLAPEAFWALSLAEWRLMTGTADTGGLDRAGLDRAGLEQMMQFYPDTTR